MKILSIESSGLVASAALLDGDVLICELTLNHKKTHSQTLLPMIARLKEMTELELSALDGIAVSAGPGSFTGLRIGAGTAKGIAAALDKPIIPVGTLEALSFNLAGAEGLVCPLMDARRDQVYTGIFDVAGEAPSPLLSPCAISIDEFVRKACALSAGTGRRLFLLGDGVPAFHEQLEKGISCPHCYVPAPNNRQRAASVAALGELMLRKGKGIPADRFAPVYLRPSQAERVRGERLSGAVSAASPKADMAERPKADTAEPSKADTAASATASSGADNSAACSGPIVIRPLEERDLEEESRIEAESFSMPWSKESFKELLDKSYAHYLVAEEEDHIRGLCGMLVAADEGDISNVAVKTDFRGRGIGKLLLKAMLKDARQMGIRELNLEVRVSNHAAIRLYEGLGFVRVGKRPGFYDAPKEDALLMKLSLGG